MLTAQLCDNIELGSQGVDSGSWLFVNLGGVDIRQHKRCIDLGIIGQKIKLN